MAVHRGKVVHLTSVHRPFDVRIFEKQCQTLAERGWQVVLVAVHDQDEMRDGVQIRAIPRPRTQWQRMTGTAWRVFREGRRQHGDLYHVHDPELLPWAWLLRCLGKTVVYDMHENVPKDIGEKTWLHAWLKTCLSVVLTAGWRPLLSRLPVIFAETSYAHDYPWVKRSVTVLNFPCLERLPEPSTTRYATPTVGYIGGVGADRGSWLTLKALEILKDRGIEVGWECVGPAWPTRHQRELAQEAKSAGLSRVRFHGYLPAQKGWPVIRPCHIGLAILAPRPNYIESYPTKLFEYMALALPVITSDFPLYREVIDQHRCGLCVDPESPEALARAIEQLIRHPDEAQQMGNRGRQAVLREYSWNNEFEKLQAFYEQLL